MHLFGVLLLAGAALSSAGCRPAYRTVAEAGPDYAVQGEYEAVDATLGAQVIARGEGRFELVLLEGGLPGRARLPSPQAVRTPPQRVPGERRGPRVAFSGPGIAAHWEAGRLRVQPADRRGLVLERVDRQSPTLGAPPPRGATVLFDGQTNRFGGALDEQGNLEAGATSPGGYRDFLLHVEFRTPFMPRSSGQSRGNSGVYLQRRYEVQIVDSFGRDGANNESGALYEFAAPRLNMALPPLAWQTYDIEFRAARFAPDGTRTQPARVTVRHNGVLVQDDVALEGPTGQGDPEGPDRGPIYLQDHWNPVVFRNVWILERGQGEDDRPGSSAGRAEPPLPRLD